MKQYISSLYLVAQGILPEIVSLLFIPWSWYRRFFLTKSFQPREWPRACVCEVAPETTLDLFNIKDDKLIIIHQIRVLMLGGVHHKIMNCVFSVIVCKYFGQVYTKDILLQINKQRGILCDTVNVFITPFPSI